MVLTPFDGRETVGELFAADMESFDEFEVVEEFSSGDTYVFFWRGRMEGRFVEGAYPGCGWTAEAGSARSPSSAGPCRVWRAL